MCINFFKNFYFNYITIAINLDSSYFCISFNDSLMHNESVNNFKINVGFGLAEDTGISYLFFIGRVGNSAIKVLTL